jgi:hypothetical protein
MRALIYAGAAMSAFAVVVPTQSAVAQSNTSGANRVTASTVSVSKQRARTRAPRVVAARNFSSELQDRSRVHHQVGKFNGQELFDAISDQAGNAGE